MIEFDCALSSYIKYIDTISGTRAFPSPNDPFPYHQYSIILVPMRQTKRGDITRCDDPFWTGCKKPAAYKRVRKDNPKPQEPDYLCEECFMRMEDDAKFNPNTNDG
jgi:hypothetical protein